MYARCPLTILDDVFSGLDPVTDARVAQSLFGPQGLMRQPGKTVVLASHSRELARSMARTIKMLINMAAHSLHLADQIVVLSADGNIAQVGTLDQLVATNAFVQSAYQKRHGDAERSDEEIKAQAQTFKYEEVASMPSTAMMHSTKSGTVYWHYFNSLGTINVYLFFFLGLAFTFTLRFPDVWLSWWSSDGESSSTQRSTGEYLGVYVGLQMATLIIVALWAWYVRSYDGDMMVC